MTSFVCLGVIASGNFFQVIRTIKSPAMEHGHLNLGNVSVLNTCWVSQKNEKKMFLGFMDTRHAIDMARHGSGQGKVAHLKMFLEL